jgi:prolipoprotein diacylglyceryl transferase
VELAYLPSPSQGVWHLGPIPIRGYALCIVAGIVAAVLIGERRWVARGGRPGTVMDLSVWAVLFGLVGGRLYHVLTDPELYFGAGRHPLDALKIWQGGLGIWGAIALGGVGAWLGCRRRGIRLAPFADALAPGIAVAQAIGRWGNWFNQELFGRPTTLPWGLKIDPSRPGAVPGATAYHPTFLYESLWDLAVAGLVVWADRRFRLGRGRAFALYVMAYTVGRFWIEALRVDQAHHILGLRLNGWTSVLVFAGALVFFVLRRGPRETEVEPVDREPREPADREPAEAGAEPADISAAAGAEPAEQPAEGSVRSNGARSGDTAAGQPAASGVSGPERPAADVPSDRER